MQFSPFNVLSLAILLPVVGAGMVWAVTDAGKAAIRLVALATTLAALVLAGYLVLRHVAAAQAADPAAATIDYGQGTPWIEPGPAGGLDVRFAVGLDGLSFWLFGLTALLMVTSVLVSWTAIQERPATFYSLLLLLESGMLGVFAARDVILFYVFFEFTLIPLFFLIGVWGSEERRYAAIKFFLFTLAGSLLTFLGLLAIVIWNYYESGSGVLTFSIPELTRSLAERPMDAALRIGRVAINGQVLVFLALFAGFAIKVPLFPLHTWLPLAHVQAPTAGSVLLAGVLLKIGTYGFLRFSLPMLPEATALCAPWILWLATGGILYGALVALAQGDMKRLIAYSSVSHLGYAMLGIFALNNLGLAGGSLQMINHGLSTGGLFAVVGMLYERYHTREIAQYGGLAARMPWLAFFMLVFTFSSIGLPGLNGFAGEFPILLGMFQRAWSGPPIAGQIQLQVMSVLAVAGVVLGAWYMLWLVKCVFFGPVKEPHDASHGTAHHDHNEPALPRDLSWREIAALAPLVVFIVWIGVAPQGFIGPMSPALEPLAATDGALFERVWQLEPPAAAQPAVTFFEVLPVTEPAPSSLAAEELAGVR